MNTEQWFQNAQAYFNGTMTTEEAQLFEKETAASDELSQLMQLWKCTDAEAAMYEQHKEDAAAFITTHQKLKAGFIGEQTNEIPDSTKEISTAKHTIQIWKWVAAAAAITAAFFMVEKLKTPSATNPPLAQHKPNTDSTTTHNAAPATGNKSTRTISQSEAETLYAQAFQPDDVPEDQGGILDDAFVYYQLRQYKNTIKAIDNADSKAPTRGNNFAAPFTDFYKLYYKALSLMSLNNATDAIPLLQQALQQKIPGDLKSKTQWYLALAYLKLYKIADASATLQSVISNPKAGVYKSKAEALHAALNTE